METGFLSPLDHWAIKEFGKTADMLVEGEFDDLISHLLEVAQSDEDYWRPRNERMLEDQKYWEVGGRRNVSKKKQISDAQDEVQESEVIELNHGYLVVDKITSMGAGAGWMADVPPKNPSLTDVAQKIENMLLWGERELNVRHALALNSSIIRDEFHYAVLRGWIAGMIIPNIEDTRVPWNYILEDPLFVYPRYSGTKLLRVSHRYTVMVLEAKEDFPELYEYLKDKKDDDKVEITVYYDEKYKIAMIGGHEYKNSTHVPITGVIKHGYKDIDGHPINPWIIVTPRGTPTRRVSHYDKLSDRGNTVANIGLGVIHPIRHVIEDLERLVSQLHTEVAKGVNGPAIIYYDGANKPERLDLGIGGENYFVLGQEKYEPIQSTAMKPDGQALLTLYQDLLQRGSVPSVLYGQSANSVSGYAISLLTQGAKDVMQPLLDGVKLFRELRFRRMLEMYVNISSQYMGPLTFGGMDQGSEQYYTGNQQVTPQDIISNGVFVDVRYDDLVPQDRAQLTSVAMGAVDAGVLPLYDAMKDWIGIKDPKAALLRLAEGINYKNPGIMEEMAMIAARDSGNPLLQEAVQNYQIKQQQMMALQMEEAKAKTAGKANGASSGAIPPNMQADAGQGQVPAKENPMTAIMNQMRDVTATGNVENGGNMPLP